MTDSDPLSPSPDTASKQEQGACLPVSYGATSENQPPERRQLAASAAPVTTCVLVEVGDVVVSKFGNRWRCESWTRLSASGNLAYVLHNTPPECPDAKGTIYSGPLPEWADRVERDGLRVWQRPTPRCQCPSFAKAKGPYPSGFCPDCGKWYPGITRAQAIERGDIAV